MTSWIRPAGVTAGIGALLICAAVACSGAQAPTPINSIGLPSGLPSVDVQQVCEAMAGMDSDLEAVAAAAAAAAEGGGFELEDAEARVDDLIAGLEGLAVNGDVAPARDAAVQALRDLRGQLPDPGPDTSQIAADALTAFGSVRESLCV